MEVQLDKQTLRRLRLDEKEYMSGRYKIARIRAEIDKVLARVPTKPSS